MIIAVISDVHANLAALKAVIKDMDTMGVEAIYSLGDVVGYGPQPRECLDLLLGDRRFKAGTKGNHEYSIEFYLNHSCPPSNISSLMAAEYTFLELQNEAIATIIGWPEKLEIEDLGISLVHGSFTGEHLMEYIKPGYPDLIEENLSAFDSAFGFIGHTHIPFFYQGLRGFHGAGKIPANEEITIALNGEGILINVGSVGQPRDRDTRASYGLLALNGKSTFTPRRVSYDINETVRAIETAGLDEFSGQRLQVGI